MRWTGLAAIGRRVGLRQVPVADLWAGRSGWSHLPVPDSWWEDRRVGTYTFLKDAAAGKAHGKDAATIAYWEQLLREVGPRPEHAIEAEYDQGTWWIFDGFHRLVAAKRAKIPALYVRAPEPSTVVTSSRRRRRGRTGEVRRALDGAPPQIYFASGSNHAGEIRGLAEAGHAIGVAVDQLNAQSIQELRRVGREFPNALLFVDSGAFGEVKTNVPDRKTKRLPRPDLPVGTLFDVEPITHREWLERLEIYRQLARVWGGRMWAVAPDKVANQSVTARRLKRYRDQVRLIAGLGANIIVVIHKGSQSMQAFDRRAQRILGLSDFVRGVPMMKDATSPAQLARYFKAIGPQRVHFLGLAPTNDRAKPVHKVVAEHLPDAAISWDSVALKGLVGKKRSGPEPLTLQQDLARARLEEYTWGTTPAAFMEGVSQLGALDYTEAIAFPSEWASPTALKRIADKVFPPRSKLKAAFKEDPDSFLQGHTPSGAPWWSDPVMAGLLDKEWAAAHASEMVAEVKRQAFRHIFSYQPRWRWQRRSATDQVGQGVELVRGRSRIRRWGLIRKHGPRHVEWVLVVGVQRPDGSVRKRRWSGKATGIPRAKADLVRADRRVGALGGAPPV